MSATSSSSNIQNQITVHQSEEERLSFLHFDYDTAYRVGTTIRSAFLEQFDVSTSGCVISVHLFTGHTLFACAVGRAPHVGPDNWDWIRRKTNTFKRFGMSSLHVGRRLVTKNRDLDYYGPDYACHGGAFPIFISGVSTGAIGVVAVSGLSQEDDHRLVVDAIKAVIDQPQS